MDDKIKKFIAVWVQYQRASKELDELKKLVVDLLPEGGAIVDGYKLSIAERPVFSNVTLDEARKFDAVKKVVNTTVLTKYLNEGKRIKGVDYTKFVQVRPII